MTGHTLDLFGDSSRQRLCPSRISLETVYPGIQDLSPRSENAIVTLYTETKSYINQ
jgi:hypothetical protein